MQNIKKSLLFNASCTALVVTALTFATRAGMIEPWRAEFNLTAEQVLFIHSRLIDETGGSHGVRDTGLLLSAVERPKSGFGDTELYPDIFAKSAALMESLIKNHPFIDGNKRTAITSSAIFLQVNGHNL